MSDISNKIIDSGLVYEGMEFERLENLVIELKPYYYKKG